MEDGGFKLPKIQQDEDYKPEFTPELQTDSGKDGEEENSGVFTETLARIYIKQASIRGLTKSSAACISSILTRTDIMLTSSDSLRN